jgi:alpha/beta superfamily hydrolase
MAEPTTDRLMFPCGKLSLEGALHVPAATPAPGVVVCHPHPQYGGDMDNNVVLAACRALTDRGIAALRFNFRGVGRSDGAFDHGKGERDDVRAALSQLSDQPEVDAKRVGLIGYSFGATVAAEVAGGQLRGFALISPPIAFGDLRVDWDCPALVLGGDQDPLAPADRLRVVAERADVELRIVSGADHSWWGFEDDLGEALGEFFERQLLPGS